MSIFIAALFLSLMILPPVLLAISPQLDHYADAGVKIPRDEFKDIKVVHDRNA